MKLSQLLLTALCLSGIAVAGPVPDALEGRQVPPQRASKHLRPVLEKRQQFEQGQPISKDGKGGPILGKIDALASKSDDDGRPAYGN